MVRDDPAGQRPRVAGEREQEILDAALEALADVGYDRLTLDAVAARAHASKATLYRRWNGKLALVIDALTSVKTPGEVPDTGSLRGDLLASFCCPGGLADPRAVDSMASVVTAITRDAEFAEAFRREVIGPKMAVTRAVYERARARGEIRADLDLDLVGPALAGIVLHRHYALGERPEPDLIARVLDQIVLPAVLRPAADVADTGSAPTTATASTPASAASPGAAPPAASPRPEPPCAPASMTAPRRPLTARTNR